MIVLGEPYEYPIYRGCLILAHVGWEPLWLSDPDDCANGFSLEPGGATFQLPHALEARVTIRIADAHPMLCADAVRAMRVPYEVSGDLVVSNIDWEDDTPVAPIPHGRYELQFEAGILGGNDEDGLGVRYDARISLVRRDGAVPTILVTGHECMTTPIGPPRRRVSS